MNKEVLMDMMTTHPGWIENASTNRSQDALSDQSSVPLVFEDEYEALGNGKVSIMEKLPAAAPIKTNLGCADFFDRVTTALNKKSGPIYYCMVWTPLLKEITIMLIVL